MKKSSPKTENFGASALAALDAREDLKEFGNNRLLLFALELRENLEDIKTVALDSLTDGSNDKKCDLVYVNREQGLAIVAQGYSNERRDAKEAPANKASDLNTAAAWLLGRDFDSLPTTLKAAAIDLDEALRENEVTRVEFWYVHNLPGSKNVETELERVESTARSLLTSHYPTTPIESVSTLEVDIDVIGTWYRATQAPILVTDSFSFETTGGFTVEGDDWSAYSTMVPARWLADMYRRHGRNLFTANVRDYLGSRSSDKNINYNIKVTARDSPRQFWAYNNGITALVNDFRHTADDNSGLLEIDGIAVVNGAQTTGALGSLDEQEAAGAFVQARFIKCNDADTVLQIIRYNNSQNKIEPADYRSNDHVQQRLRAEFASMPKLKYNGGRRGGDDDKIKRVANLIPSETAGQALAAFHGEPDVAYNKKGEIWKSDSLYSRFFSEKTSARHIVFVYSLHRTVEDQKLTLMALLDAERTESQQKQITFFRQRGSVFLLSSAVAKSLETIISRPIPNLFRVSFAAGIGDLQSAVAAWTPIVARLLPFANQLAPALLAGNLRKHDSETTRGSIENFRSLVESTRDHNSDSFSAFAKRLQLK